MFTNQIFLRRKSSINFFYLPCVHIRRSLHNFLTVWAFDMRLFCQIINFKLVGFAILRDFDQVSLYFIRFIKLSLSFDLKTLQSETEFLELYV